MIKNSAIVVLGTVLIAFGTSVFQIPFNLIAGGMSGIAIALVNIIDVAFMTEDFYITVMTWGFFIVGLLVLGRAFAMKTLISTIVYPPAFSLCRLLVSEDVFGGLFVLENAQHGDAALLVAAFFGGIIIGAGVGIAFLGGGSTGGIDIIALAVSKKFKRVKSSHVLLLMDTTIILVGAFVLKDLVVSLLGIVSAFASSVMVDRIFGRGSKAFVAFVISDKHEEINNAMIDELDRTTTIVDCVGGFSSKSKKMLLISFNMSQYSEILTTVLRIDKGAFITVHRAHEINGEGWTWNESEGVIAERLAERSAQGALGTLPDKDNEENVGKSDDVEKQVEK